MAGVAKLGWLPLFEPQIDGRRGLSGEDDAIVAGAAQFVAGEAAHVGLAQDAGQRAAGDEGVAAGGGGAGAGQRTGHHDERVIRAEGVGVGVDHVVQVAGGQAAVADELAGVGRVEWLVAYGPSGEIDEQEFAEIAVHWDGVSAAG